MQTPSAQMPPATFAGRYSDGRTAASHEVRVGFAQGQGQRPATRTLVIWQAGAAQPLVWPLASLHIAEQLRPASIDVMIHEPGRGGATLFVADRAFIKELAVQAPRLTSRARRWQGVRPFVWVVGLTAATAALIYVTDFSPARSVAKLMPRATRVTLGREVVRSMSGGHRVCSEPAGKAALTTLAKRLSEASGRKASFDVVVVDSDVINAFAAPGEQIVIMRKLIDTAQSSDEVAGVLAHEMGHGLELHPETSIVRAVGLMAITEFMLGGTGGSIANIGLYLAQLGYSRQAERQADAHAVTILKTAGIATKGITDFFHRMSKPTTDDKSGSPDSSDGPLDMLRTHPSTKERLALFENQPRYDATPALDADAWSALRSICGSPGPDAKPAAPPINSKPKPARPAKPRDI